MPLPALNTFAGNPLDRAGDRRNDPEWLAEQAANPEALALVLWEGRPLLEAADEPRLAWLPMAHARAVAPDQTELEAVAWLTRDEARACLAGTHPTIKAPPKIAIARTLLQAWVDGFEV